MTAQGLRQPAASPFVFKIRAYISIETPDAGRHKKEGAMRTNGHSHGRIDSAIVTWIMSVFVLALFSGCSMQSYGRFALDSKVGQDFRKGVIQPKYQYYYAGRNNVPYAIIGIDAAYTVPSRYWIPFKPQPGQLERMSANIFDEVDYTPYGAHILAPDGSIIGVWYSNVLIRSVSVDQKHHTVQVLFKNPENKDDGDFNDNVRP
jgi:hypothetical protein